MRRRQRYEGLLYSRGFLFDVAGSLPRPAAIPDWWQEHRIGGGTLWCDRDAEVFVGSNGDRLVALVGFAVDPWEDEGSTAAVVHRLAAVPEAGLLDAIDQLTGRFALLVLGPQAGWLLQDACGTRAVYYTAGRTPPLVSSHATLLGAVLGLPSSAAAAEQLAFHGQRPGVTYLPGLMSPIEGVHALTPNTRLDLGSGQIDRIFPRASRELRLDLAEVIREAAEIFRRTVELVVAAGPVRCSLTAGRDSRLTLAAGRNVVDQVTFFSHIDPADPDPVHAVDLAVAKELARRHGLRHEAVEMGAGPRSRRGFDEFRTIWQANLGLPRGIPGLVREYADRWPAGTRHLRSNVAAVATCFYGDRSFDEISGRRLASTWARGEPTDRAESEFARYIQVTALDVDHLHGYDASDLFYWEHRLGQWHAWLCLESDMSHDTFVPFNNRRLLQLLLTVPRSQRSQSMVLLGISRQLWPELMDLPVNPSVWPTTRPGPVARGPVQRWRAVRRARRAIGTKVGAGEAAGELRTRGKRALDERASEHAGDLLSLSLELDDRSVWAWSWLALLAERGGDTPTAIWALERAVALRPGEARFRLRLGRLRAVGMGDLDAVMEYEAAAAAAEGDVSIVQPAAEGLLTLGSFSAASAAVESRALDGAPPSVVRRLADLKGDADRAREGAPLLGWLRAGDPLSRPRPRPGPAADRSEIHPRVLMCLHQSVPVAGGYATRSHEILRALSTLPVSAVACTPPGFQWGDDDGGSPTADFVDGVTYLRSPPPSGTRPPDPVEHVELASAAIERAAVEHGAQVIHATSFYPTGAAASAAARRLDLPFVYEVRGLYHRTRETVAPGWPGTSQGELDRYLEASVARSADLVITLTSAMREELVRMGVRRDRIELFPNCVDPRRFQPRAPDLELAAELGVDGATVIGYAGSFAPYEGVLDLIRAAELLRTRPIGADIKVVALGSGRTFSAARRLVEELDLGELVQILDPVPHGEVHRYLSIMDIVVVPRRPVPVAEMVSPLKPFEAMAMGRPLVLSSVDALREIAGDGERAELYQKGDVDALADALESIASDPPRRAELAERARTWVLAERTWEGRASDLVGWYGDLVRGREPATVTRSIAGPTEPGGRC